MPNRIGAKLSDILDHLGDFRAFQRPFLILLAVFSVFYFSELANFSLSIDDELAAARGDAAIWAAQGRWLSYLVEEFLISQPVLPFFPVFIFGCLVCAGYVILVSAHGYQVSDPRLMLVFCLFCAFPTLYFILDFAGNTLSLGLGILASCVCVFLFDKAQLAYLSGGMKGLHLIGLFALLVGLGAAAIGAYQSLILLIAAGCCGVFILRFLRGPAMAWRQVAVVHAYLICAVLASAALNFLIARGFQRGLGIEPAYIGQLMQVDLLIERPASVLMAMVREYWQIYGGKRAVYGFRYITFPALILLGLVALAAATPGRTGPRLLFAFVYLLGITTIPFAMNVITGGDAPYRALVAVPYVFWFLAAGAVLSGSRIVRRLAVVLVVIVVVQCLYTFSMFQATKRLVLEHDMQLAAQIYDRIALELPDFDRSKTYRVDFYGAHEFQTVYREIKNSTLAASFFEWDGGNPYRIATFMNVIGYSNIGALDPATRKAFLPELQTMPIWPRSGSVKVIDDVVLVRLGKEPGSTHLNSINAP